jgi:His-Xaa-Ser system protein HxsD
MEEQRRRQEQDRDEVPKVAGVRTVDAPQTPRAWTIDGRRIALELDLAVYSIGAIRAASYKFTDRCYVYLALGDAASTVIAVLAAKETSATLPVDSLLGEYVNEILDQQIRESLAADFGPLQNLIAAQAFAEGNLLDPERDDADYRSDPRGVRRRG